jgi:hypothetical protein
MEILLQNKVFSAFSSTSRTSAVSHRLQLRGSPNTGNR